MVEIITNSVPSTWGYSYTESICASECAKCKGKCCKIGYEPINENKKYRAMAPANTDLADLRGRYYRVSGIDKVAIEDEAVSKGLNIRQCRFLGEEGCIIPREERTQTCRQYVCDKLREMKYAEETRARNRRYQREYRARKKGLDVEMTAATMPTIAMA